MSSKGNQKKRKQFYNILLITVLLYLKIWFEIFHDRINAASQYKKAIRISSIGTLQLQRSLHESLFISFSCSFCESVS